MKLEDQEDEKEIHLYLNGATDWKEEKKKWIEKYHGFNIFFLAALRINIRERCEDKEKRIGYVPVQVEDEYFLHLSVQEALDYYVPTEDKIDRLQNDKMFTKVFHPWKDQIDITKWRGKTIVYHNNQKNKE